MDNLFVGIKSYSPALEISSPEVNSISNREKNKYSDVWAFSEYSHNSPGAGYVDLFWSIAKPQQGETLLDIGAGSGAASRLLKDRGLQVTAFDLTSTAWRQKDIQLITGSIWKDIPEEQFAYGYCCDVMEHIPTEFVSLSIKKIIEYRNKTFFSISFNPDSLGILVQQPLHLTVKPFMWWLDVFRELGTVYEARDLMGEGIFYVG